MSNQLACPRSLAFGVHFCYVRIKLTGSCTVPLGGTLPKAQEFHPAPTLEMFMCGRPTADTDAEMLGSEINGNATFRWARATNKPTTSTKLSGTLALA